MWMMELATKTTTAESSIGSQRDVTGTMGTSWADEVSGGGMLARGCPRVEVACRAPLLPWLDGRQELRGRFDAHVVAERREEMPPVVGDDHGGAGAAGHFRDVRVVDASAGDPIVRRRAQH